MNLNARESAELFQMIFDEYELRTKRGERLTPQSNYTSPRPTTSSPLVSSWSREAPRHHDEP